ncbi:exopolysaccharide biosynthesis protein [Planctobacterium marinum]|uniref:exopolysaccharide biosynthesis protein n=1 Tax=Planctobacterium marinum TaxID=1631968 RepID=UPI001E3E749A|nr:exopolysaccharide biosynthesis protein [Planctobacterium marinum]MCC2604338.1 exopolysaccharide biosynthesis protein [Planctobacterium marinum]
MTQNKNTDKTLFTIPETPRTRTSDVLVSLIEQCGQEKITLRMLTDRMGDRTFGLLLILLSIFNVIPFVSLFAGILIMCLGIQMSFGRTKAWLPKFILERPLSGPSVAKALLTFEPKIRAIERFLKPRWQFTEAFIVDRINGFIITLLGAIITLPVPFTNLGPALVLMIMGLGLLERDGLVQIAAALLGVSVMTGLFFLVF